MQDEITVRQGRCVGFAGEGATNLFRAMAIKSALGLLAVGIKPNRLYTKKNVLRVVSEYTGKTYKQTQLAEAAADLAAWIETARKTIPVRQV
jgi:hypothetical protein